MGSAERNGEEGEDEEEDEEDDGISIFDEDGETMVGMEIDPARRAALEQRRSLAGDFRHEDDGGHQVRLSRELEEGFMDDSDDGDDGRRR